MTPQQEQPPRTGKGHEHEWERLFYDGVAVAARCKVCSITPLDWLDSLPLFATPSPDALREALDRAWIASNDAFGMARPADLGDHLVREYAALAATPSPSSGLNVTLTMVRERLLSVIEDAESQHPGGWGPDVTTVQTLRECLILLQGEPRLQQEQER